ncbi:MAG: hypothetical protein ACR2GY_07380, partial [Phycisphaerales bacterium]
MTVFFLGISHVAASLLLIANMATSLQQDEAPHDDVNPAATVVNPAEELLDRLEADAVDLRDFQARVHYRKLEAILEETEIYVGSMIYHIDPERPQPKRFAILFEKKGNLKRLYDRNQHYIFDGVWLVERNPDEKQFIKRQIVAPGETFDPLRLGEGPFPLPLGQKKDDVLRIFEAEMLERPRDGELLDTMLPADVLGLALTPKP